MKFRGQTPLAISREVGDAFSREAAQIEGLISSFTSICVPSSSDAAARSYTSCKISPDWVFLAQTVSPRANRSDVAFAPSCSSTTRDSQRLSQLAACSYGLALEFKLHSKLQLSAVVQLRRRMSISLSITCFALNLAKTLLVCVGACYQVRSYHRQVGNIASTGSVALFHNG